jgi:hypothetical protein
MAATSGEPYDWPFELFDPPMFRVPERKVNRVFLHCDPFPIGDYNGIGLVEEINQRHCEDGWKGIRWHFVVDKEGNVITGRSLEETPIIDASDMNGKSIAITAHSLQPCAAAQFKSVIVLCRAIHSAYELEGQQITFQVLANAHIEGVHYDSSLHGEASGEGGDSVLGVDGEEAARREPVPRHGVQRGRSDSTWPRSS